MGCSFALASVSVVSAEVAFDVLWPRCSMFDILLSGYGWYMMYRNVLMMTLYLSTSILIGTHTDRVERNLSGLICIEYCGESLFEWNQSGMQVISKVFLFRFYNYSKLIETRTVFDLLDRPRNKYIYTYFWQARQNEIENMRFVVVAFCSSKLALVATCFFCFCYLWGSGSLVALFVYFPMIKDNRYTICCCRP